MHDLTSIYLDGHWVARGDSKVKSVTNPATEEGFAKVTLANASDVDLAVKSCQKASHDFAATTIDERIKLLQDIARSFTIHQAEMAAAITTEMGAPISLSTHAQTPSALYHLSSTERALQKLQTERDEGNFWVRHEAIGICGLITPWNWPANQIACKLAAAIAAGCTFILKPSLSAPYSAHVFAKILDHAGVPKGVFQLIQGTGAEIGSALASHPNIDMISFTGSKEAGISVSQYAATTIKRVVLELGGKSPHIILPGSDLHAAIYHGTISCMANTGQSCNAPSRMLIPKENLEEAIEIAKYISESLIIGDPKDEETFMGPAANLRQWNKIQDAIRNGIQEGARLITGGLGKPNGLDQGFYVKPTVFAQATNNMSISREEIFGPVLTILGYGDTNEAVSIANDTTYGLAAYIFGPTTEEAKQVAKLIKAGTIHLNGASADFDAPFGGYKQSGNGREWGLAGIHEFLETKAIIKP
jgi:aldehyde dehydrogenase (NAD+)